jgi:protein-S-isoprenylcysteine O-methyltransferase Ste14
MSRTRALLGSLAFLVLAPGTVAGLVPWWLSRWELRPPLLGLAPLRALGGALVALGAAGLLESFARFALGGLGTPAPIAPPGRLVVGGLYRHVRNPMYVAVVAAVLGQGLLLGHPRVLGWGLVLWLGFHLFVIGYEEPTLRRTFGGEYEAFRAEVPRWIPRLRPWTGARPASPPRP